MVTAEQMRDLLPATDAEASQSIRQDLDVGSTRSATAGTITRRLSTHHRCVPAALLGGAPAANDDPMNAAALVEGARVQLWCWLHGGAAVLEDGTPIDFNPFDAAIQRVGERPPRRGLRGQRPAGRLAAGRADARAQLPPQAALVPPLARTL
jgi:hypothetical protein